MFNSSKSSLSFEQYVKAAEALHALSGILLFEFCRRDELASPRDQIARNFVARADMAVKAILQLWQIADYPDCWILHRALLDRLFLVHDLNRNNQFDQFEDWSFKRQYEAAERLRSDHELKGQIEDLVEERTAERKARYNNLRNNPPQWQRPKPEEAAKEMDLGFLYKYGYDFASRYVHPMADDGQQDFYTITRLVPGVKFSEPESTVVLSNSILVASMILQEALNVSTLRWGRVVYTAVEGVRKFLLSAAPEHHIAVAQVATMFADQVPLAQPSP